MNTNFCLAYRNFPETQKNIYSPYKFTERLNNYKVSE